ncbi:MAG: PQQ-binding-like beta-propeller repeat protein [Planctomycetia bacterium]|nr:PQQ-binding-like beta-propeller repeat protein [Planctomycetia bacterium]
MFYKCLLAGVVGLAGSAVASAGDWPAFRGPHGNGWSEETNVPTKWSKEQNIRWKFKLPDEGNSSPIVVGKRVFITCGQNQGRKRGLYCLDRDDGSLLWSRIVDFDKVLPTHATNPYCSPTPASDGKHVVVWHGSAGLFCYDLEGKELWQRDLGEFRHVWGYAASPIIYQDRVIQNCAPGVKAFLAAFDLKTGKDLWRVDEPTEGNGEKRKDGAPMGTFTTPIVVAQQGQDQIVCFQPRRVVAYQPADGKIIWESTLVNPKGDLAYSSPMIADGVCVALGGYNGSGIAFKLGAKGDIGEKDRLWYKPRNPQSIGTGVVVGGYLYVPDAGPNTIRCLELLTGKEAWSERIGDGAYWGSIVMAEGRAYVTTQAGTTIVFKPSPEKFELIAENKLGEHSNSTPAISDGRILIRTFEHLYCIGEK